MSKIQSTTCLTDIKHKDFFDARQNRRIRFANERRDFPSNLVNQPNSSAL